MLKKLVRRDVIPYILMFCAMASFAQKKPNGKGDEQGMVFKSQSRLVVVDVVAKDKLGRVVIGLRPQDLQISENGVPQKISFFEDHTYARTGPLRPKLELPPNQYTNFPSERPKDSLNVVLFDLVNTPTGDQNYARKEMLKALETLPKGHQLALFILGNRLQMIQGPTGDSDALVAAARTVLASPSRMVQSSTEVEAVNDQLRSLAQQAGGGGFGTPSPVDEQLRVALTKEQSNLATTRVEFTLSSLEAIARIVSGYSGRKNLIWLTAGIPFELGPDMKADMYHRFRDRREFAPLLERAEALLADAQIAIYPIDVGGLTVGGMDSSMSGRTVTFTGKEYSGALKDQSDAEWNNRIAMKSLADQTGGKAIYGSNDLAGAIGTGIEDGSRYYTIAYVPQNFRPDGKYRSIKVEPAHGELELKYRKGYLATAEKPASSSDAAKLLASQMLIGVPASTALLMKVEVKPPEGERKTVRVEYAFAPGDLTFQDTADKKKRAVLDLMAVVWNDKGQPALSTSNTEEAAFKEGTAAETFPRGVPGRQEFTLPAGKYMMCLGAMDRATEKIGTVWVPLVIEDKK